MLNSNYFFPFVEFGWGGTGCVATYCSVLSQPSPEGPDVVFSAVLATSLQREGCDGQKGARNVSIFV